MQNIEQIYEKTRQEIERIKTEQAVRMEKIKTLASELNLQVDANLPNNVAALKQQTETQKGELEEKLNELLKELESDGINA
jgi:hypothetical protein